MSIIMTSPVRHIMLIRVFYALLLTARSRDINKTDDILYKTRTHPFGVSSLSFYIYVLCVCVVYFVCVVLLIQCPEP